MGRHDFMSQTQSCLYGDQVEMTTPLFDMGHAVDYIIKLCVYVCACMHASGIEVDSCFLSALDLVPDN